MRISHKIILGASLVAATVWYGCREVVPYQSQIAVQGYEIAGKVITANGIPIDSVNVILSYGYDYVSMTPNDTVEVIVSNPPRNLYVDAITPSGIHERTLYSGIPTFGRIYRLPWDGLDDSGNVVPDGGYIIRYVYGIDTVKRVPYLVDQQRTAISNKGGGFTLTQQNLPIGQIFDVYDDTTYEGTYAVDGIILLTFTRGNLQQSYEVEASPNELSQGLFILQ